MANAVYIPKSKTLFLYDKQGKLSGGLSGKVARRKVRRLRKQGIKVKVTGNKLSQLLYKYVL